MRHTPSVDVSDDGPKLDQEWTETANNVCGTLRGCPDASHVAESFAGAGWRVRSTSWDAYEVETNWCNVEIDPAESTDVLLNGVVDPRRIDQLAGLLDRFGPRYSLELYDGDDRLVREIQA